MNKETIITAIVTLIVAVLDLLKVFGIYVPIDDNMIYIIVSFCVAGVIYWRNQPWTKAGLAGTLIGREIKEDMKNGDLTLLDKVHSILRGDDDDDD